LADGYQMNRTRMVRDFPAGGLLEIEPSHYALR
jgi:hypothetical protein